MITNFILNLLFSVISFILSPILALPNVSLPADISDAITQASNSLALVNVVVPVSTILAIIGLFFVIEIGILIFKIINYVIRKIPTIS